jgi:hypothetical protein
MTENTENINENSLNEQKLNKYMTRKKIIDFAKIGEKLSLTGSNCHYCKGVMTVQESNACRSILLLNILDTEKLNLKKKNCNKKFCYECLQKVFPNFWQKINNKDWKCPCCLDECLCSQCKKLLKTKLKNTEQIINYEEDSNM